MQKLIPKKELNSFIDGLIRKYDVIAPVNTSPSKFQEIKSSKEIYLDKITDIPLKQLFIPEHEVLFNYNNGKILPNNEIPKQRIVFGLRLCDINALKILDTVMLDSLYINKRKNTLLIGIFCDNPDDYCFCNSMDLENSGYDLFLYPNKNNYIIEIGSDKGKELVKDLKTLKTDIKLPKSPKNKKILYNKDIENNYRNKIWENDASKCLSCSACTAYCPTCNCFDIKDTLDINLKDGFRFRTATSCQLKSFTRVAGGKSYRDSRLSRFKHFVYHKIVYYKKHHGRFMCVGCGRCLRVCPTKIDWVNTINLLKDLKPTKNTKTPKNLKKNIKVKVISKVKK